MGATSRQEAIGRTVSARIHFAGRVSAHRALGPRHTGDAGDIASPTTAPLAATTGRPTPVVRVAAPRRGESAARPAGWHSRERSAAPRRPGPAPTGAPRRQCASSAREEDGAMTAETRSCLDHARLGDLDLHAGADSSDSLAARVGPSALFRLTADASQSTLHRAAFAESGGIAATRVLP